jgi:hypothetical protein
MTTPKTTGSQASTYALCLNNEGYEASLLVGKVYQVLPDAAAEQRGYLRVVDESGDDYAFATSRFYRLDLPAAVAAELRQTAAG